MSPGILQLIIASALVTFPKDFSVITVVELFVTVLPNTFLLGSDALQLQLPCPFLFGKPLLCLFGKPLSFGFLLFAKFIELEIHRLVMGVTGVGKSTLLNTQQGYLSRSGMGRALVSARCTQGSDTDWRCRRC